MPHWQTSTRRRSLGDLLLLRRWCQRTAASLLIRGRVHRDSEGDLLGRTAVRLPCSDLERGEFSWGNKSGTRLLKACAARSLLAAWLAEQQHMFLILHNRLAAGGSFGTHRIERKNVRLRRRRFRCEDGYGRWNQEWLALLRQRCSLFDF